MYWVHTHAADGIVHVEAPASVYPTLGDFLDIWEETYPDDELLANAREAIAAGEVTVDDKPFAGDALALAAGRQDADHPRELARSPAASARGGGRGMVGDTGFEPVTPRM